MPGTHTTQTQRCIKALLAAGYKRSEFKVQTPFDRKVQGYGVARIYVFANADRQRELAPKVEEQGIEIIWSLKYNGETIDLLFPIYKERY